jgi:acetyl-CoA synthetase
VLQSLGVRAGERVVLLLGRIPELYVATYGALKARCVVSPLFSAFGPESHRDADRERRRARPRHD